MYPICYNNNEMKRILSIILFISYAYVLTAQSKKITVTVLDALSNEPLPWCVIKFNNWGCTTNNEGIAYISLKKTTIADVSYLGYETKKEKIDINKNSIVIKLYPKNDQLSEVEVVENKVLKKNTSSVGIIDKSVLKRSQNNSIAEILSSVTGCRILSSGAMIEKPIIEGMSGSRVSIVDNNSKLMGQHWGDDHSPEIDIPSYAKVSVIKGAEGVKYGANAIGGVVVVDTDIDPREKGAKGGLQYSLSSNGFLHGGSIYFEDNISLLGNLRYRLGYKQYESNDYSTAKYRLSNTGSWIKNIRGDMAYNFKKFTFHSHISYYDTEIGIYRGTLIGNMNDLIERYELGYPPESAILPINYDNIDYPKQRVSHILTNSHVIYNFDDMNILNIRYSFQKDYRKEYSLRLGKYKDMPEFAFKLYSHSLSSSFKHIFRQKSTIELGTSLIFINNISDKGTGAVPIIPNYVTLEGGLFAISNIDLSEKTILEAGVRTDFKYTNSNGFDLLGMEYGGIRQYKSISGTMGVRHNINKENSFNINAGLAWRAPEMNELYSHGLHHGEAVYQEGDPNLKTEKSVKVTAGYNLNKNKMRISLGAFGNYIFDYIYDTPRFETVNGVREPIGTLQNSGYFVKYFYSQANGLFYGGDITVDLGRWFGFGYTAKAEFIRAKNTLDNSFFPNIPSDRLENTLSYVYTKDRIKLEANVNHTFVAKQRNSNIEVDLLPETPDAYNVFNSLLSFSYNWDNMNSLEIYLQGKNITNNLYKEYTNRLRYFMHEKGYDITLGIRYSF